MTLGSFTIENHLVNIVSDKKDLKIDIDGVLGYEFCSKIPDMV